ncbi:outer membrane beta-barrel protein [bacterium]|nr:outer membrane beta-barrel protein [bacterium]
MGSLQNGLRLVRFNPLVLLILSQKVRLFLTSFGLVLATLSTAVAQTAGLKVTVVDEKDQPLVGAAVVLNQSGPEGKRIAAAITDVNGQAQWNQLKAGDVIVNVQFIGYQDEREYLSLKNGVVKQKRYQLKPSNELLAETQIVGQMRAEELRGDTSVIKADAFTTNADANAAELLNKMPGLNVQNGTVEAQGESVGLVLVDGKPFFGENSKAALDVLPADMVDEVKVYDRQSDQSRFTGFKDGNTTKTIDIITKKDKKFSHFGEVKAFYGSDDHYEVGGNLNWFRGSERWTLTGNANNVNILGFDAFSGGGPGFRGSVAPPIPSGQIELGEIGLNYSNSWSNKLDVQGGYRFSDRSTRSGSDVLRLYTLPQDSGQVYRETNQALDERRQHSFNLDVEWNPDSANTFEFNPNLSFAELSNQNTTLSDMRNASDSVLNSVQRTSTSSTSSWSLGGRALYGHRFRTPGRTLSTALSLNAQGSTGSGSLFSENRFGGQADTLDQQYRSTFEDPGWSLNTTYTEPLLGGIGELSYEFSQNRQQQDRRTFNLDENGTETLDSTLSTVFSSPLTTHAAGMGYSYTDTVWEVGFRLRAQQSTLDNAQTLPFALDLERRFDALLPEFNVEYQARENLNWRLRYRTSTQLPSIDQLQNAIDNSNPVLLSTGNPLLRQAYSHSLFTRMVLNNPREGNGIFAMLNFNWTEDYIGTSTLIASETFPVEGLNPGQQLSLPENMQGAWSARAYASWGFASNQGKLKWNVRGGVNVNENPSRINLEVNRARNINPEASLNVSSNLNEFIDFNFNSRLAYSSISNSLNTAADNSFTNFTQYGKVRYQTPFGLVLETDLTYQGYFGLNEGFDDHFVLWNAGVGYKFLKNRQLEAKVRFFDLLGQNASISRTFSATFTEDRSQLVLEPYVLFGLTWKIGRGSNASGRGGRPGGGPPR